MIGAKLAHKEGPSKPQEALLPISDALRAMRTGGGEEAAMRQMVDRLNAEGKAPPGGGKWHSSSLHKALARIDAR